MNHCQFSHEKIQDYGRIFLIAILVNLFYVFVEMGIAFYANSSSLFADAGHNLADVLGLCVAMGANWLAQKKPTQRFSYGYKRCTIVSAFLNAVALIMTAFIIGYESLHQLFYPEIILEKSVMIAAVIGIGINAGTAVLFMREKSDLNIRCAFLHLLYDAFISFGVVIGAIIISVTHWWRIDGMLGIGIVVVIFWGSFDIFKRSLALIIDAVPHDIDIISVKAQLLQIPGVEEVHDLHVWALGTQETALSAHVYMPNRFLSQQDYLNISCVLQKQFNITHITIQVEQEVIGDEKGHIHCGC